MKTVKRITALLLCSLMLLTLSPAMAEIAEHSPLWIGNYTLSYWINMGTTNAQYYTSLSEHPFMKWMEEQTGIHIEFVHPSEEQKEQQFNMMIASGSTYDLLFTPTYTDGPQAAIDDGVYLDLYPFSELLPDYLAAIRCGDSSLTSWEWGPEKSIYYSGPQPAFVDKLDTKSKNLWCVSQVWTDAYACACGPLIRKDWLDDLGLKIPQTLDEFALVLEAFKAKGDSIIPMSLSNQGTASNSGAIVSAFGIYPDWFTATQGKVNPVGYITPEFKEYLTLMNKWYSAGYIDPDFMNRDYPGQESLLLSDKLGILLEAWASPSYYEDLYSGDDKDFSLVPMALPRMSAEQTLQYRQSYDSSASYYTVISAGCKQPEIACRWLNTLYTKEAYLRANYGVEGESYEMRSNVPYYTDWFYQNEKNPETLQNTYLFCAGMTGLYSYRAELMRSCNSTDAFLAGGSSSAAAGKVWGENALPNLNLGYVSFGEDSWGKMNDQYTEAQTYAMPMILKYITGTESLDSFDTYATTALELGFEGAREQVQAAYDAQ